MDCGSWIVDCGLWIEDLTPYPPLRAIGEAIQRKEIYHRTKKTILPDGCEQSPLNDEKDVFTNLSKY